LGKLEGRVSCMIHRYKLLACGPELHELFGRRARLHGYLSGLLLLVALEQEIPGASKEISKIIAYLSLIELQILSLIVKNNIYV